jgi:hypothetical protein
MSEQQNNPNVGPVMDQVLAQQANEALNRALAAISTPTPPPAPENNR